MLYAKALELYSIAQAIKPHDSGQSKVVLRRGDKLDWFVGIMDTDPNRGNGRGSVLGMEKGHLQKVKGGYKWVPGHNTLGKAASLL